jgi:hypothetical protein
LPVTQLDGTKLSGLSYRLDGVTMKGSDLGKRYSPAGLAKHGVSYDKERDLETVASDGYGRLAGFTAHDEECRSEGKRRFVLARERTAAEASNALKFLQHIETVLREQSGARKRIPSNERSSAKQPGRAR